MKELQSLHVAAVQNMEFITLTRETTGDIEKTSAPLLETNAPLKRLVSELKTETDTFEEATKNPAASEFTPRFERLDRERDTHFRRFGRRLAFYELSDDETEQEAYLTLAPLWQEHKNTPNLNRKQQTGATDNFINDTQKKPYAQAIATLAMQPQVSAIKLSNDNYRAAQEEKRAKAAETAVNKAKDLRQDLNRTYAFLCTYIHTMANALPDDAAWDKLLVHVNIIRKRYTELLNRRRGAKGSAPTTENPPATEISPEETTG